MIDKDAEVGSALDELRRRLEGEIAKVLAADANMETAKADMHRILTDALKEQARELGAEFQVEQVEFDEDTQSFDVKVNITASGSIPFILQDIDVSLGCDLSEGDWAIHTDNSIHEIISVNSGFDVAVKTRDVETGEITKTYAKELKKIPKGNPKTLRTLYGN